MAELGVNGAEVMSWFGLMAPAGTPRPAIEALDASLKAMSNTEEFKHAINEQGMDVTYRALRTRQISGTARSIGGTR